MPEIGFRATPSEAAPPTVSVVRITTRMNVGGIARHVSWLTAGLEAKHPTLLVAGVVPPGEDDMTDFALAMGVKPHVLPQMSREISLRDVVTIWKLFQLFRQVQPRIVHTHAAKAGTVGRVAGWLYRWCTLGTLVGHPRSCRFVHTYHGHVFHSYYGPWKTWIFLTIERILARLVTDRIVVISPQQYREIHQSYRVGQSEQFAVIPLGLDLSAFAHWQHKRTSLREELGCHETDLLVGIVGRLTEIKNHRLFLEVAARFRGKTTQGRRVRFLIIGDGHLRERLESEQRELHLDQDVTFLGMRRDPDYFYPALDVVAITSFNEGTPLTLIEGMANARPFVATNVGGVVDLAGEAVEPSENSEWAIHDRGVVVSTLDADTFADALQRLLNDERLRRELGHRGLEFVHDRYGKERLLRDVESLYDSLTPGESRCRERFTNREGKTCAS